MCPVPAPISTKEPGIKFLVMSHTADSLSMSFGCFSIFRLLQYIDIFDENTHLI